MRKAALISIMMMLLCFQLRAQHNPVMSQYMFNGLVINPGYAGAGDVLNATISHRNQWTGFEGAPVTSVISIHSPLKKKKLNAGILVYTDKFGVSRSTSFNGILSYRILVGSGSLRFGLTGGADLVTHAWDQITTTNSGDVAFSNGPERYTTPTGGAGFYYEGSRMFLGLSAPKIFSDNRGKTYKPFLLTAGYLIKLKNDFLLKPSLLARYIHGSPFEADLNLNCYYKQVGFGASWRTNDAIVLLLQYRLTEQLSAGYSYDAGITRLRTVNKGSHEIMLKYEFGFKVNAPGPRYF
jgi:type IX secretion system PorP/SprF family membrane protein